MSSNGADCRYRRPLRTLGKCDERGVRWREKAVAAGRVKDDISRHHEDA